MFVEPRATMPALLAAAADYSWTFDPGAVALIALLGYAYVRRWRAVRRTQDRMRGAPVWRLWMFLLGELLLVVALVSPVDGLAEQVFAMHMTQHVILLDLVPVCFMLSFTRILLRPLTRASQSLEQRAGLLMHPAVAVALYVAVMAGWHVPALYDAALEHPFIHVCEHVCFLSAGLLYWWHLLSPIRSPMRGGPFSPVVYMLATKLLVGMLGIVITFAPDPLYDFYIDAPRVWGLSPLDDQAVAGAIMAVEQSIVMGIVLAWLFVRALGESQRADERAERYG
jgi:cytochrome c oxidase assembly factor CtaG